jgi:TRAP-type mannitol/chloroaromatic compound transport system permease small subunit
MHDIFAAIAHALLGIAPGWMRLPSLTFVLPHWLYWGGLLLFPLFAMYMVRKSQAKSPTIENRITLPVGYLFLLTGGLAGLHRFYMRSSKIGYVFIALLVIVLYSNSQGTAARTVASDAHNAVKIAEFDRDEAAKAVKDQKEGAPAKLAEAEQKLAQAKQHFVVATADHEQWNALSGTCIFLIGIMLLIDIGLLPRLRRRAIALEADRVIPPELELMNRGAAPTARNAIHTPATRMIEAISRWSGTFVAYWSAIAVIFYYYEVIARYVFNSPTDWVHESMFLMFGMQYLISGAYAYLDESHVRVDVIYERFSERGRAIIDIITSVFFFIFTGTLLVTGVLFAWDSISVWEVSFTEWAIQYWPVKIAIPLGALLILLQGLARLIRDVAYVSGRRA